MRPALFYCFLFLVSISAASAQYSWENYELINTQQGLPHNMVLALKQDTEGFLWIGTYNGLCVYDGYRFTTYDHMPGTAHNEGLPVVNLIYEDRYTNMWIASWGGRLSCYSRRDARFKTYHPATDGANKTRIKCIAEDKRGRVWVGQENGSLGYISGDSIYYTRRLPGAILNIIPHGYDSLKVLTGTAFYAYSILTGSSVIIPGVLPDVVTSCAAADGSRIFAVNSQAVLLDAKQDTVIRKKATLRASNRRLHIAGPAADGNYIYTDGLTVLKGDYNGQLSDSFLVSDSKWYNKDEVVNCITADKSNIIWIGTSAGLLKIDRRRYLFRKYAAGNSSAGIATNYIRAIGATGKELWLGYKAGPVECLLAEAKGNRYRSLLRLPLQKKDKSLSREYTTNTLLRLKNGNLLAGGELGVYQYRQDDDRFRHFLPALLPDDLVMAWSLLEDSSGNIWIGTYEQGLYVLQPDKGRYWHYPQLDIREGKRIWNIYRDSSDRVWIGTEAGLYQAVNTAHPDRLQFRHWQLGHSGPQKEVWHMAEDGVGNLWVGTTGDGLFRINSQRDSSYPCKWFPAAMVSGIVPDQQGRLWISTINGLYRYDPRSAALTRFGEQDGLVSNDFNFKAAVKAGDYILLGTKMGLLQFCPDSIHARDISSVPLRITGIRVSGKAILLKDTSLLQKLYYNQNYFDIDFALLDFAAPQHHVYRYRLQGFDTGWHLIAGQPHAVYTNIPPGQYRFVVQGSINGKEWSRSVPALDILIRPALWQQPLFWFFCVLLLLSGVAWLVWYRMRKMMQQERQMSLVEKQMAALELNALQAQMNPHFIFNVLNALQGFILHRDELRANDYLSRFARLMRLFLESSKNRYITIAQELDILGLYLSLEQLRFEDKFTYSISCAESGMEQILIPSMLIQPFAENAILHGLVHRDGPGLLQVTFSLQQDGTLLCCTIEDNGIGRQRSAAINAQRDHISRGMELIRERVKTYNFIEEQEITIRIEDRQTPEEGTIVTVLIPLPHQINKHRYDQQYNRG